MLGAHKKPLQGAEKNIDFEGHLDFSRILGLI